MTEWYWSASEVAFLQENAADMTAKEIAKALGSEAFVIRRKAAHLGLELKRENALPNTKPYGWTEERIARMKSLYLNDGLSCSQIAKQLGGVTRNAVIGKIYRLGIERPPPSRPKAAPRPTTVAARVAAVTRPRQRSGPPRLTVVSDARLPEPEVLPPADVRTVPLMELNSRVQCGWSVGDEWCAEPKTPGGHFCTTHKRIGVVREIKRPPSQTVVARTRSSGKASGLALRIWDGETW